jgi:hypothetical protein
MPWDLDGNNLGANLTEWLGTRDAQPLVVGTQTGSTAPPTATTEALRITPVTGLLPGTQPRSVGIGTTQPQRRLHVEPSEIHSGGSGAGFSFSDRGVSGFTENPTNGQRWVWYASGGRARLWSGTDKIEVTIVGGIRTQGTVNSLNDVTALGSVTAEEAVVGDRANFSTNVFVGGDVNATRGRFGPSTGLCVRGTSSDFTGVLGISTGVGGSSGGNIGVRGSSASGFAGVSGESGNGFGVRGISTDEWGVVGVSTARDGVRGESPGQRQADGTFLPVNDPRTLQPPNGVSGFSRFGHGVFGLTLTPATKEGGFFDGGIAVVNGAKNFKIDHPLDPENRYLVHTCVESSEMKNVYDGVARLDADGAAWVELPEWFEALNGDFRYQLTAVGDSTPNLHVAEEVSENRFKIAGGEEGMKVCWQLTCSRKDPWAAANPFEVEQEKPEEERGRYLEPSLYEAPEEQRINIRPEPETLRSASTIWTG